MALAEVRFPGAEDAEIGGLVATPDTGLDPGSGIGLVVAHGAAGLDDLARELLVRAAEAGLVAIAPDLYSREGESGGIVPDRRAVADLERSIEQLLEHGAQAERIGVLGFAEGGVHAFLCGCASRRIEAVVAIAWQVVAPELSSDRPVQPLEMALNLSAPLLALFGAGDETASGADTAALDRVGSQFAKDFDIVVLPGARHGFLADRSTLDEVWRRALSFLTERLGEQH